MKHLGLVPILLLFGVGLSCSLAIAELTAYQQVPAQAAVGETVLVTVMLTYNGINSTEAVVMPNLPSSIVTNAGMQQAELYPGAPQPISYPIMATQNGNYLIVSLISWNEGGAMRNLRLEDQFMAFGEPTPTPPQLPGEHDPAFPPGETHPGRVPPDFEVPDGDEPREPGQDNASASD